VAWYDIKLDGDSPKWRAYQEEARRNDEELKRLGDALRIASGLPAKKFPPLQEPSIEFVRMLRDRFEAARRRPKPTPRETEAYWARVKQQVAASSATEFKGRAVSRFSAS
jgi:hypothetical protein